MRSNPGRISRRCRTFARLSHLAAYGHRRRQLAHGQCRGCLSLVMGRGGSALKTMAGDLMHPVLRLYEDVLSSAENVEFRLPPLPRFIFVVHGSATIAGKTVNEGEAWQGEGERRSSPVRAASPAGAGSSRAATGHNGRQRARHDDARKAHRLSGNFAERRIADARRQRRLSARRLRLYTLPPGPGHPLHDRGRHPHRHPWPLDLLRRRAAPGTKPGPTRCSRRPRRTARAASSG